ncbi:DoxX family protein [Streptomyces sp. NPDC058653]|uniref:DoxX family protein n=1 Tax=Streptomyces sp. NPDC058653 TaxID=3346576 RepID=UPI0036527BCB
MNVFLWVLQTLLALIMFGAGAVKVARPYEALAASMGWVTHYTARQIKGISVLEMLAAIGLVVPGAVGIATVLTPLAATGLGLLMIGAALAHIRENEKANAAVNVVFLALAVVIAWGRSGPYPF